LDHVQLRFGSETIFEDLSFEVRQGEFVCLLGPSGCGKSTSLRLMGDLLQAHGGSVEVAGLPPSQAWEQVAFVFQSPRLAPWRNASTTCCWGWSCEAGVPRPKQSAKAQALLDLVGLGTIRYTNFRPCSRAASASEWPLPAPWRWTLHCVDG
jgi:NitT/TauT family transport system ATP-binding protein